MVEILNQILNYLVDNYALYMVVIMSIIISLTISLITLIKKPIKKLTGKIHNENLRKFVNKIFIVFAFGISGGCWVALHFVAPEYFAIDTLQILLTGAFSVVLYAFADGIFSKPKAKQLVDTITDFVESEKTQEKPEPKKETDPIKEFWKKVK